MILYIIFFQIFQLIISFDPVIEASRSECVAPCAIFFNAIDSSLVRKDFREIRYFWNFGDGFANNWGNSKKNSNFAEGGVTAHLYETPGSFSVELTMVQNSIRKTTYISVTIDDIEEVFQGKTRCVSKIGDFENCPVNAEKITSNNVDEQFLWISQGSRLLFHRGEAWDVVNVLSINSEGPGIVGAYGECNEVNEKKICENNPIFQRSTGGIFSLSGRDPVIDDWRIMDITCIGLDQGTVIGAGGMIKNVLLLRIRSTGFHAGFVFPYSIIDYWNTQGYIHEKHENIFFFNNELDNPKGGGGGNIVYCAGINVVMMGNDFINSSAIEHVIRTPHLQKAVISHNRIFYARVAKHLLKLHAPQWDVEGVGFNLFSEYVYISDNIFRGDDHDWSVAISPQSSGSDERIRNVVIEKNHFYTGIGTQVDVLVNGVEITVRENMFLGFAYQKNQYHSPISVSTRGIEPSPVDVEIFSNTIFSESTKNMCFVTISVEVKNSLVNWNIGSSPFSVNCIGQCVKDVDNYSNTTSCNENMIFDEKEYSDDLKKNLRLKYQLELLF